MRQQHPRIPTKKELKEQEFGKPMPIKSSTDLTYDDSLLEKIKQKTTTFFKNIFKRN